MLRRGPLSACNTSKSTSTRVRHNAPWHSLALRRQQTALPPSRHLLSDCRASSDIAQRRSAVSGARGPDLRIYLSCGSRPLGSVTEAHCEPLYAHTPWPHLPALVPARLLYKYAARLAQKTIEVRGAGTAPDCRERDGCEDGEQDRHSDCPSPYDDMLMMPMRYEQLYRSRRV
eukprot:351834-Prymnesium_polylepis.1